MSEQRPLKPLTSAQVARAKVEARKAFEQEYAAFNPEAQAGTTDLVHDNKMVVRALAAAISLMPFVLAVIMVAAVVISADKTYAAFNGAAAHKGYLGIWAGIIGLFGVLMTEGALVFAEFAAVRQRLQKGLKRQVMTLPKLVNGVKVRLGLAQPLDYDEMPDSALAWFARLVFILVLSANVFVATMPLLEKNGTSWAAMTDVARLQLGFAVFMGVVAPLSLKFVGSQMAHLSYELYQQRRAEMQQDIDKSWRAMMEAKWNEVGDDAVGYALHRQFLKANNLPLDANTPYLLVAGQSEGGEAELNAVPLATSPASLLTELQQRSD